MRASTLLAVVSAALLGFAPAPFPRPERPRGQDPTDVEGTWEFVTFEVGGRRTPDMEKAWMARITKEEFCLVGRSDRGKESYAMRLSPAATPCAFDWHAGQRVTFVGIYRLQKDQLTMVFRHNNQQTTRPTNFEAEPAGYRFVLRRVKR
jgi:uncharacterized protein (TIGR03067 family)